MSKQNLNLGRAGEELAVGLLKEQGYKILLRNYRTKFGEIDIIAEDKDTICFVEVKARHENRFGLPSEAVSWSKQKRICKAALAFLKEDNLLERKARFDVVTILGLEGMPKLELIKNAFELNSTFSY